MLATLVMLSAPAALAQTIFFHEGFDSALDPAIWRTENQNGGVRWCSDSYRSLSSGTWLAENGPWCHGEPWIAGHDNYSYIANGALSCVGRSDFWFPFLCTRQASVLPFPASGDFTLSVLLKFDTLWSEGAGIVAVQWDDPAPTGSNAPAGEAVFFKIWASFSSVAFYTPETVVPVPTPTTYHEYTMACTGTAYSYFIDGQLVAGPMTKAGRPSCIWIGNPEIIWWWQGSTGYYVGLSVDDITVSVPAPVATRGASWGDLKSRYR